MVRVAAMAFNLFHFTTGNASSNTLHDCCQYPCLLLFLSFFLPINTVNFGPFSPPFQNIRIMASFVNWITNFDSFYFRPEQRAGLRDSWRRGGSKQDSDRCWGTSYDGYMSSGRTHHTLGHTALSYGTAIEAGGSNSHTNNSNNNASRLWQANYLYGTAVLCRWKYCRLYHVNKMSSNRSTNDTGNSIDAIAITGNKQML